MPSFSVHQVTQGALLEKLVQERPEREALIYPARGLRWTFADLEARSLALARGLIARGIQPGERVTVWADNRPDWIPLQFALARIGAILVTANTALTRREIGYLLSQSKSSAVIAAPGRKEREYVEALGPLLAEKGALPDLRLTVIMEGEPGPGMITVEELVWSGEDVPAEEVGRRTAATTLDQPANIQYTSGTTGFPKGVVLTHGNLVENAWAGANQVGVGDQDSLILMVPLFHCFGCSVIVLGAYTHGVPIVALQNFDPAAVLQALAEERCTIIDGVPAMYRALLDHPEFPATDVSSVRAGIMAGSVCPEPLMRQVNAVMGGGISAAYGLTEASPGVSTSSPDAPLDQRCTTVGPPYPGIKVRIVDPATGCDLPPGGEGELWISGPNVMQGYFEDPESTARTITADGWLMTGDLATQDAEGRLRIVGRIKEMIIRGGENVYPAEVEDVLRTHPQVADAAVFGFPSERMGEEVGAAVVPRDGAILSDESLGAYLEDRLASFKRPARYVFLDGFPMTPSGKVRKFKLAEML